MHGKTSMVRHDGRTIFRDLPNPFEVTRYHSLIVNRKNLPECFEISAETAEGEIMGMRHKTLGIEGGPIPSGVHSHHCRQGAVAQLPEVVARPSTRHPPPVRTMIKDAIHKLAERANLTESEAETVMGEIMDGSATPAQIAAYLMGLRMKGRPSRRLPDRCWRCVRGRPESGSGMHRSWIPAEPEGIEPIRSISPRRRPWW